jgi:hypothetical protein
MRTRRILPALFVAVVLTVGPAGPAHAAKIDGFVLESMKEVDDGWSLNDRIGRTRAAAEHVINIEDCVEYRGHTMEVSFGVVDPPPASGDLYTVKLALPGKTCPTSDLEDGGTDDGCRIIDRRATPSSSGNKFQVRMDLLTGGDCDAGISETATIYVVYQETGTETPFVEPIDFDIDLERPAAPTAVEVFPGEVSVLVSWQDGVNTDNGMRYRVYYRAGASFASTADADGSALSGADQDSLTVTGLTSDTQYWFRVVAVDPNDNESELSADADVSAVTVPSTDFWELYKDSGGRDPGGFCFLATAAYGTPLAEDIDLLRRFRDGWLLTSAPGRAFVTFYYEHSPPLARAIRQSPLLAAATRVLLVPLVFLAWFLVELGLLGKLTVLAVSWGAVRSVRTLLRRGYAPGGPALHPLPLAAPFPGPAARLPEEGETC